MKPHPPLGVINYGTGNFSSVFNALRMCGFEPREVNRPGQLAEVEKIILPGVGTFGHAMGRLTALGLLEAIAEQVIHRKKPYLGICVGMQILADRGFEVTACPGLGWIPGEVRRLEVPDALRLPHIGWDEIEPAGNGSLLNSFVGSRDFYFVHSYELVPRQKQDVLAWCDYGRPFAAAVRRGNIYGVQFHPEKSQVNGLALLKSFVCSNEPC